MTEARYCSVTNESSMPWRLRSSKMCPRHGLSTMGTIGFGRLIVRGRRRLPSPPAMTTACIWGESSSRARASGMPGPRASTLLRADREERLEVVARVGLERDVGLGARDAAHLRDPSGDDVGELVVLPRPHHRHEVEVARDRVHLGYAVDRREGLAELRQRCLLRGDQDDGRYHLSYRLLTSMSCNADFT